MIAVENVKSGKKGLSVKIDRSSGLRLFMTDDAGGTTDDMIARLVVGEHVANFEYSVADDDGFKQIDCKTYGGYESSLLYAVYSAAESYLSLGVLAADGVWLLSEALDCDDDIVQLLDDYRFSSIAQYLVWKYVNCVGALKWSFFTSDTLIEDAATIVAIEDFDL